MQNYIRNPVTTISQKYKGYEDKRKARRLNKLRKEQEMKIEWNEYKEQVLERRAISYTNEEFKQSTIKKVSKHLKDLWNNSNWVDRYNFLISFEEYGEKWLGWKLDKIIKCMKENRRIFIQEETPFVYYGDFLTYLNIKNKKPMDSNISNDEDYVYRKPSRIHGPISGFASSFLSQLVT